MNPLSKFLIGKSSRKIYIFLLWLSLIFLIMAYLGAYFLYDGSYSILANSVSSLGNQIKNPDGSWLWRVGMILGGVGIIPIINYMFLILKDTAKVTSKMFLVAAQLSCLGVIGVGIFPENISLIHHTIAAFTFFGFMFAFCCNVYTFGKLWKNPFDLRRKLGVLVLYFILFTTMGGFLLAFSQFGIYYFWGTFWPPINLFLPLWEWLIFIAYLIYLAGIFFLVPFKPFSSESN